MADFISIYSTTPNNLTATKVDQFGGLQIQIGLTAETVDALLWIKDYKARLEREARARELNESVRSAYEQYQTVLKLVLDIE